jgi:hypothetical protein
MGLAVKGWDAEDLEAPRSALEELPFWSWNAACLLGAFVSFVVRFVRIEGDGSLKCRTRRAEASIQVRVQARK